MSMMTPGGSGQRGEENLEWFAIDDFSPGIVQKINNFSLTGASPAPIGAARLENTYRCVALPGGGIGPLPKRFYDYSRTAFGTAFEKTVTGFHVAGPIYTGALSTFTTQNETDPTVRTEEFLLGFSWETTTNHRASIEAFQVWSASPAAILEINGYNNASLSGAVGPTYFDDFRDANGSPGAVGYKCVVGGWCRPWNTSSAEFSFEYPAPGVGVSPWVGAAVAAGIVCTHQSRMTVATRTGTVAPWGTGSAKETETIYFSDPMDPQSASGEYINIGPENPSSIGVLASLSASDLLVIKHRGGAYLVQGDLAFPTVRHLPGVTSTGGTECVGAGTRLGFVYGVNNGGVYVWAGADESTPLAPQLEDNFWIPPGLALLRRYKGRFTQWKDYILTPNNWLFDMNTKGWWRLEDEDEHEYGFFQPSPFNNVLFGACTTFSDESLVCISGWNPKEAASSYSWQSQTLPLARSRRITLREIQVIAQGVGTVTVTLTGSETSADVTVTFDLPAAAATHPVLLRKTLGWEGEYLSVRIESEHTTTGAAPIVQSLRGGYHQDMKVGESGAVS